MKRFFTTLLRCATIFAVCLPSAVWAQSQIFTENFDAGIPAGWTINSTSATELEWRHSSNACDNTSNNFTNGYMIADGDCVNNGTTESTTFTSPSFNCSGFTDVTVQFNHYYRQSGSSSGVLEYNIGAGWVNINTYNSSSGNPEAASFTVNALDNESSVQIRFTYSDDWDQYWYLDDFVVVGCPVGANSIYPYTQNFDGATTPDLPACGWLIESALANQFETENGFDSRSGDQNIILEGHNTNPVNDWLITPALAFTAGVNYEVTFWYKTSSTFANFNLSLGFNSVASSVGMTTTSFNELGINNSDYVQGSTTITPSTSGTFYLGFHLTGPASTRDFYIDDFEINICPDQVASVAGANTYASATSWDVGIVPRSCTDVTISSGSTVTINQVSTIKSLTIEDGGTLVIGEDGELTINESVTVSGTLTNNGAMFMQSGQVFELAAGGHYTHNPATNNVANATMFTAADERFYRVADGNNFSTLEILKWYNISGVPLMQDMSAGQNYGNITIDLGSGTDWDWEGQLQNFDIIGTLEIRDADVFFDQITNVQDRNYVYNIGNIKLADAGAILGFSLGYDFGTNNPLVTVNTNTIEITDGLLIGTSNNIVTILGVHRLGVQLNFDTILMSGGSFFPLYTGFSAVSNTEMSGPITLSGNDIILNGGDLYVNYNISTTTNHFSSGLTSVNLNNGLFINNDASFSLQRSELVTTTDITGDATLTAGSIMINHADAEFYPSFNLGGSFFSGDVNLNVTNQIHITDGDFTGIYSQTPNNSTGDLNLEFAEYAQDGGVFFGIQNAGGTVNINNGKTGTRRITMNGGRFEGNNTGGGNVNLDASDIIINGASASFNVAGLTATGEVDVDVADSVLIKQGNFVIKNNAGGGVLTVDGNLVIDAGTLSYHTSAGGANADGIAVNAQGRFEILNNGTINFDDQSTAGDRILNINNDDFVLDGQLNHMPTATFATLNYESNSNSINYTSTNNTSLTGVKQIIPNNVTVTPTASSSNFILAGDAVGALDFLTVNGVLNLKDVQIQSKTGSASGFTVTDNGKLQLSNPNGFYNASNTGAVHDGLGLTYLLTPQSTVEYTAANQQLTGGLTATDSNHYYGNLLINGGNVQQADLIDVRQNLTINSNHIDLNGQTLRMHKADPNAIVRTTGYLVSEDSTNGDNAARLAWKIGLANRAFVYPFGRSLTTNEPIPVQFTSPFNEDIGFVEIGTYKSNDANLPYPSNIDNMNGGSGADISEFTINRFWEIELENDFSSGSANVQFTYLEDEATLSGEADVIMQHWNGSGWDLPANFSTSQSHDGTNNTVVMNGVNDFSPFTAHNQGPSGPLPVDLLSFTAGLQQNSVALAWSVANEINLKEYQVLKSIDGEHFSIIQSIAANGSSSYATADVNLDFEVAFYKLKMIDFDGAHSYSDIQVIDFSHLQKLDQIQVYPTVVQSNLTVELNAEKSAVLEYSVVDVTGKTVLRDAINITAGHNVWELNVEQLANQGYWLQIAGSQHQESYWFTKQ